MIIRFSCACGRVFRAEEGDAGRHIRCPFCGRALVVPGCVFASPEAASPGATTEYELPAGLLDRIAPGTARAAYRRPGHTGD